MYVVTLSVFHNLAIWLLYVNKPELEKPLSQTANRSTGITDLIVTRAVSAIAEPFVLISPHPTARCQVIAQAIEVLI